MRIQNLKDLKLALKDVPDKILEDFGAGFSEDPYVELLVYGDESEFSAKWEEVKKVFPAIVDVSLWIKNISLTTKRLEKDEHYEGYGNEEAISSEDKI